MCRGRPSATLAGPSPSVRRAVVSAKLAQAIAARNEAGAAYLPGHLGRRIAKVGPQEVVASLDGGRAFEACNGYLRAGGVLALADSPGGYGTLRSRPGGTT